jgi:transposase
MVVLGADLHKRSHTVVVIDGAGRKLAERRVAATAEGHLELRRWASQWSERTWALEDCRHLSRRLEADILRSGESVVRVPPKLMAGARRSVREPGKSDPIDALAVAQAALREPGLPVATLDGPERELRLHVDHREDLVGERTRHEQRLRWFLVELGIAEPAPRSLGRIVVQDALDVALIERTEPVAGVRRFRSRGRAYLDHRRQAGDTKTEAIRAIRRRISDEVFRRLQADEAARASALAVAA